MTLVFAIIGSKRAPGSAAERAAGRSLRLAPARALKSGFPFCMRWIARAVGKLLAMVGMGLEILSADVPERGST